MDDSPPLLYLTATPGPAAAIIVLQNVSLLIVARHSKEWKETSLRAIGQASTQLQRMQHWVFDTGSWWSTDPSDGKLACLHQPCVQQRATHVNSMHEHAVRHHRSWLRSEAERHGEIKLHRHSTATCSWPNVTSSEVNRYHSLSLLLSSPPIHWVGEWRASLSAYRYVSCKSQV